MHVGHNVQIGAHTVVAAQTGISGSSTLGHHVIVGGQVGHCGSLQAGRRRHCRRASRGFPQGKRFAAGRWYGARRRGRSKNSKNNMRGLRVSRNLARASKSWKASSRQSLASPETADGEYRCRSLSPCRLIVVGGHTRSIGKTQLVCDLIAALPISELDCRKNHAIRPRRLRDERPRLRLRADGTHCGARLGDRMRRPERTVRDSCKLELRARSGCEPSKAILAEGHAAAARSPCRRQRTIAAAGRLQRHRRKQFAAAICETVPLRGGSRSRRGKTSRIPLGRCWTVPMFSYFAAGFDDNAGHTAAVDAASAATFASKTIAFAAGGRSRCRNRCFELVKANSGVASQRFLCDDESKKRDILGVDHVVK